MDGEVVVIAIILSDFSVRGKNLIGESPRKGPKRAILGQFWAKKATFPKNEKKPPPREPPKL